jgi:hypothetical protein
MLWTMLVTNHVLSGALIGALSKRPDAAFTAGVASHFALDSIPHIGNWGSKRRFLYAAVPDGLTGLAVMAALTAATPPSRRLSVLAGMTGAALPDIDKPARLWFGRSPFPAAVDHFHAAIQNEDRGRLWVELTAAGCFTAGFGLALRRMRKPDKPS